MTFVEFFDKDAIENICACLVHKPDKVIFIGSGKKEIMRNHIERYEKIFSNRGIKIEFAEPRTINEFNLEYAVNTLSRIVEENDDCVFGLTGGNDLHLVAMGIVFEKYKETKNIQMHRFDLKNNKIYDIDQDGKTIFDETSPSLSVQENIRIYGGDVIFEYEKSGTTFQWEFDSDFMKDITFLWEESCNKDIDWNKIISVFAKAESIAAKVREEDYSIPMLHTKVRTREIVDFMHSSDVSLYDLKAFAKKLYFYGLLPECEIDEETFFISFKNEQIKKCLTKAGQVLELKITILLMNAFDENNKHIYNDVMSGVYIDWDGVLHSDNPELCDISNEIDVLAMHGTIPVFVSCKNGNVGVDELYKLNTVAHKFGGKYAKKVLIASGFEKDSPMFFRRAAEMNIEVFDNLKYHVDTITDEELTHLFEKLWTK